jgi:hypothetical protein
MKLVYEYKIKRSNGNIDTIILSRSSEITKDVWEQMIIDTRQAGKGERLSYRLIKDNPTKKSSSLIIRRGRMIQDGLCPKCHTYCCGDCDS